MKQLILTGVATEQKLDRSSLTYYLVFNDGELRVPVPEETTEVVLNNIYKPTVDNKDFDQEDDEDSDAWHKDSEFTDDQDIPQL